MEKSNELAGAIAILGESAEAQGKALAKTLKDLKHAALNFENYIAKVKPYERETDWHSRRDAVSMINNLLVEGIDFKPTHMIADFLRRKESDFEGLNNMQIGRLLRKCDFKPGLIKKERGYYVKFKEL